jgi:hypothetical protein
MVHPPPRKCCRVQALPHQGTAPAHNKAHPGRDLKSWSEQGHPPFAGTQAHNPNHAHGRVQHHCKAHTNTASGRAGVNPQGSAQQPTHQCVHCGQARAKAHKPTTLQQVPSTFVWHEARKHPGRIRLLQSIPDSTVGPSAGSGHKRVETHHF